MKAYTNDNGLLVDNSTAPPTCAGYIFSFSGHGGFEPSGKVQLQNGVLRDLTQGEIDTHNRLLGEAEFEAIKKRGRGILYLTKQGGNYVVGTWASGADKISVWRARVSWHNMAGKDGRTDVWFNLDGSTWHGVNIGDNQICRVKRCKA